MRNVYHTNGALRIPFGTDHETRTGFPGAYWLAICEVTVSGMVGTVNPDTFEKRIPFALPSCHTAYRFSFASKAKIGSVWLLPEAPGNATRRCQVLPPSVE